MTAAQLGRRRDGRGEEIVERLAGQRGVELLLDLCAPFLRWPNARLAWLARHLVPQVPKPVEVGPAALVLARHSTEARVLQLHVRRHESFEAAEASSSASSSASSAASCDSRRCCDTVASAADGRNRLNLGRNRLVG